MGVSQLCGAVWDVRGISPVPPREGPDRPRRRADAGGRSAGVGGGSALRPRAWGTHSHDNGWEGTVFPAQLNCQDLFDRPNQKPSMTLWLSRPPDA